MAAENVVRKNRVAANDTWCGTEVRMTSGPHAPRKATAVALGSERDRERP